MADFSPTPFLLRLVAGLAGGLGAGALVFRGAVFDPSMPAFHFITVGVLCAAVLAAVRISWHGLALVFIVVFGLGRYGLTESGGWLFGLSGFLLGGGIYLIVLVFDLLGKRGLVIGKFMIMGPMLGGLFVALTPMVEFHTLTSNGASRMLMLQALIGVLIGDGVGLGVELVELPSALAARRRKVGPPDRERGA